MELINVKLEGDTLTVFLQGHIDSSNAGTLEKEIDQARQENPAQHLVLDAQDLVYIPSAGLRVLLRLRKIYPDLKVINVSSEVYEILDMTGFTEMLDVSKAYRVIDVEGCEVIGQGANGKVYRIDPDTIAKVYFNPDALPDIQRERDLARTALVLGIPTAIPYDVCKVASGGYASVFELLNAKSFGKLLQEDPNSLDEVVRMSVELLKQIHATEVKPDSMPDMKAVALDWADFLRDYLPAEQWQKLHNLVDAVPEDHHMMHGDYHLKNVMLQNGEVLLIDMDTLCYGHPVFEFASIYNAYQGYSELDHDNELQFLGITYETGAKFWSKTLELYFEGRSPEEIQAINEKAQVVGYTRIMRRTIRRNGLNTEDGRAVIENCRRHLEELLAKVDSLVF